MRIVRGPSSERSVRSSSRPPALRVAPTVEWHDHRLFGTRGAIFSDRAVRGRRTGGLGPDGRDQFGVPFLAGHVVVYALRLWGTSKQGVAWIDSFLVVPRVEDGRIAVLELYDYDQLDAALALG